MTRTASREIATHISFELGTNYLTVQEILELMFEPEYYSTLASEYELYSEYPDNQQMEYIRRIAFGVGEHLAEMDSYIEKYSRAWKIGRISRVAVAIMRTAMYEILYVQDIPNSVSVNEAVEIAKKYEEQDVVSFINGILGSFIREEFNV